jgi:poly-gamma-glutamate capsule biosynthesis protein CapA/YwtB (metallophosphatase superfamily)
MGLDRRNFLALMAAACSRAMDDTVMKVHETMRDTVTLFLCGDVMLGRGIDQILPHPGDPLLFEPYVKSAATYVALAEKANGPIPKPVDFRYVWGDALAELQRVQPDVRIINLETSITRSKAPEPKGIHYKMSPDNTPCLAAAGINCCVLANNHVIDWGYPGLSDTLDNLAMAGIRTAGAGRNAAQAEAPAILEIAGMRRVLVFAFSSVTSGIPRDWAAREDKAGVNLLEGLSDRTVARIAARVQAVKRPGDLVVASLHWGGNWGYRISRAHQQFAHALIEEAAVDIVHGHSSHHALGIEIYRGKPILYGCGDFINDYEGITGYEEFRDDLAVLYLPTFSASDNKLVTFRLIPFQIRKFRLNRASHEDEIWLRNTLDRESARFGTQVTLNEDGTLTVL